MAPSTVHLPNGQTLTVSSVFGGLSFKSNDLIKHSSSFPPGWTVFLSEEDEEEVTAGSDNSKKQHVIHRYKKPSLKNDFVFISAISSPNSAEFRPASSPTRQIAMMLWTTLWWYFHQPEPSPQVTTTASKNTAQDGKPKGEWRINIKREGIFKGKNLLPKLMRMGLITSEDSSVGASTDSRTDHCQNMFVTRRSFWQIDARIFLFTLTPVLHSPVPGNSPFPSRPSSPQRVTGSTSPGEHNSTTTTFTPFQSNSHLPTYYPPYPTHYIFTEGIRHPLRPKPFNQGETFYARYVPSVDQYLSFRVASISHRGVSRQGPWSTGKQLPAHAPRQSSPRHSLSQSASDPIIPTMQNLDFTVESDVEILTRWMNDPRVAYSWGEEGPESHQEQFLRGGLEKSHSFPVIGCWDGKPFGYFEIYWVKEDTLGKHLGGAVGDWDRGLHCLVGEPEFRGQHRVKIWLSALIHYCWLSDMRTNTVMMEPRVDNVK